MNLSPNWPVFGQDKISCYGSQEVTYSLHLVLMEWERKAQHIWDLGAHDFRYDFTIFFIYMDSYMNSWVVKCHIWIHDQEILYEFIYEFMIMKKILWNHTSEFIQMNSSLNSCWWIHDNEIIYEFIIMNSCVNSVLWRLLWNHGWILGNEFTYEIIINLKLFLIQLQICFSEGKCFTHPK